MNNSLIRYASGASALAAAICVCTPVTAAETTGAYHLNIPSQDMAMALRLFASSTGQQIAFDSSVTRGKTSRPLKGRFKPFDGLTRMLAGSGLHAEIGRSGIFVIRTGESKRPVAAAFAASTRETTAPNNASVSAPSPAEAVVDDADAEILVTARLRSESLAEVPDTITAFSAATIENRQLTRLSDFLTLTPNAKIIQENDSANSEVYIRGVGNNRSQASAIAFVVDGVILPDPDAYTIDFSDAEQVEILKGPQGALYGKGAMAGVINIRTREPGDSLRMQTKIGYSTGNTVSAFADVSGPLIEDRLRAGLSVKYNVSDGVFENSIPGVKLDYTRNTKVAAKFIATPTDRLTFKLNTSYYDERAGGPPYNAVNVLDVSGGPVTKEMVEQPFRHNIADITERTVYTAALVSALESDFGTFTATTAFDQVDVHTLQQDTDLQPITIVTAETIRKSRGLSQEIRFTSPGDRRLRYIVSGYYQNNRQLRQISGLFDLCYLGALPNCATLPQTPSGQLILLSVDNSLTKINEFAVSAQAAYDIVDQLELTLALRYDNNRPVKRDGISGVTQKTRFTDWQPKASLAYKPSENLMAYATYSHGFKPGAFNPPQGAGSPFPLIVKQEETDNIELGFKAAAFNRKLRINAAVFGTDYRNTQEFHLDVTAGGIQTVNVRKSRLYGFDADLVARPIKGLELNAGVGYVKSEIRDFDGSDNYVGQSLPYSPRYTINAGVQYSHDLGSDTSLMGRIDYARQGKTSFQDFQNPDTSQFLSQKNAQTVDLRLSLNGPNWTFSAFGKNVFNEKYIYSAYSRHIAALIYVPLATDIILPAPGPTWGGEMRFTF